VLVGDFRHLHMQLAKVDEELGLVIGWAVVSTIDGEPYYDLQGDHIPVGSLWKAALDFAEHSRVAKEMHGLTGDNTQQGGVPMMMVIDKNIAKAMGFETNIEGLMIAMRPDEAMLAKFKSGELTAFSIGGPPPVREAVAP